jgi:hypothetical protein
MWEPSERVEEKHATNSPTWHANCRCFFAPTNYGVVKITHSSSEVVLQTMKHTMIYPDSCPFSEVIALRPVVQY